MSSSDSDLDFESADEDTEQDKSEKEVVSHTTEVVESLSSKLEEIVETANVIKCETYANSESDNIKTKVSDQIDSSEQSFICCDAEPANNKFSNNDTKNVEIGVSPVPLSDDSNEEHPKQETQRVPLRLEKKMQQKSQHSNKSFLEKLDSTKKGSDVTELRCSNEHSNIKEKSYSWGFSSWGTSLLSTAASSVSTFSNQVSQGIGTVLETVESTLGAPSPEELASALNEKKETKSDNLIEENHCKEDVAASGILPDVTSWTKVFENTSSKVIMGGLDTLELIGKKTMDILTEGDPGLRNKRNVFSDGVNLSQILREAKEEADKQGEMKSNQDIDIIHYSQVFDDYQGLVHLEALEMLSKQNQAKFQRLLLRYSKKAEVKKRLEEIKSICENIPSLDDPSECENFEGFESVFKKHTLELNLSLNVVNIVKTQRKLNDITTKFENITEEPYTSPDEIFQSSICSLAEFTARCIETFHKVAELILVQSNLGSVTEHYASNLTGLTTVMCIEINNLSTRYHKCLDSSAEHFPNYTNPQNLNITAMVTNLYVEATNSNKYIQDAFQMLVPVLQVCLLENLDE